MGMDIDHTGHHYLALGVDVALGLVFSGDLVCLPDRDDTIVENCQRTLVEDAATAVHGEDGAAADDQVDAPHFADFPRWKSGSRVTSSTQSCRMRQSGQDPLRPVTLSGL